MGITSTFGENLSREGWKKSCFMYSMWHPSQVDRLAGRQLDMTVYVDLYYMSNS